MTSEERARHMVDQHVVCGRCLAVRRRPPEDDVVGSAHEWGCGAPIPDDPEAPNWELCRCCTVALLDTATRWAHHFCVPCCDRVKALNRRFGGCVIPVGRHTIVNGGFGRATTTHDADRVVVGLRSMVDKLLVTMRWRELRMAENLAALGFASGADVELADYLAAVDGSESARAAAFDDMVA